MQFLRHKHYDFIGIRRKAMLLSAIAISIGMGSALFHKGLKQSIDFAGGSLVEVRMAQAVPLGDIRSAMDEAGFENAEVTRFGGMNEYLIKVKSVEQASEVADQIKQVLSTKFNAVTPDSTGALPANAPPGAQHVEIRRTESVGPKIGSELRTAMFWAVIYSLIGLVIYITWRFEFRFAIAAILALVHDVCFTLGFFSVTELEVSLAVIAAVLTLVGYSLNDTIVVFDRIRENLHTHRRDNYAAVVNASINETLSRTIITSGTTLFVVICLVLFGGPVIRDFALTLLVGITVGTYSSIFIAAPIVVEWQMYRSRQAHKK